MAKAQNLDDVAQRRIQILGRLLYGEVDREKRVMLMREINEKEGVSERTLRRWLFSYAHDGYRGLLPKSKHCSGKSGSVTEQIVD
jgi:hypothetical protein